MGRRTVSRGGDAFVGRDAEPHPSSVITAGGVWSSCSYRQRARQLSEIHRDQPGHPVERTVYWIEYILRHRGAHHLRAAVHQLSFWQYFLLDVAAVLLLAAALLSLLLSWAATRICRRVRRCWPRREPSLANGPPHNGVLNGRCKRNGHVPHEKKTK